MRKAAVPRSQASWRPFSHPKREPARIGHSETSERTRRLGIAPHKTLKLYAGVTQEPSGELS